jgi:hypothetical protein
MKASPDEPKQMKKNYTQLLLLSTLVLISGISAQAKIEVISEVTHQFQPTNSADALREFSLVETKKRVTLPGEAEAFFMTDIRAVYRTEKLAQLETYAIVQFLRGCEFDATLKERKITKSFSVARRYFGQVVPFQHREWSVDSEVIDPIYSSDERLGRFALLRWNQNPNSLDPNTATFYGVKKPKFPKVFVTDLPGAATVLQNDQQEFTVRNSSLEFKTCLFKAADLPLASNPKGLGIDPKKALACWSWDHKFIYDFATSKFQVGGPIDPFCEVNEGK